MHLLPMLLGCSVVPCWGVARACWDPPPSSTFRFLQGALPLPPRILHAHPPRPPLESLKVPPSPLESSSLLFFWPRERLVLQSPSLVLQGPPSPPSILQLLFWPRESAPWGRSGVTSFTFKSLNLIPGRLHSAKSPIHHQLLVVVESVLSTVESVFSPRQ